MSHLLTSAHVISCAHQGRVQASAPSTRVTLGGQPALTLRGAPVVAGCANTNAAAGQKPCAQGRWLTTTRRVTVEGWPALSVASRGITDSVPGPAPMTIAPGQTRVEGQ